MVTNTISSSRFILISRFALRYAYAVAIGCFVAIAISALIALWYQTFRNNLSGVRNIGFAEATYSMTLGPLVEEFVFRKFLIDLITKKTGNVKVAALVSLLLFVFTHLDLGIDFDGNVAHVVGATCLGAVLTFVYARTRSLVFCVVTHIASNALIIFAAPQNILLRGLPSDVVIHGSLLLACFVVSMLIATCLAKEVACVPFFRNNGRTGIKRKRIQ